MKKNDSSIINRLFSLEGKTALVTGSSSGIGQAIAVALSEAGASVGIHGRDVERVNKTCDDIIKSGGKAYPFCADLNDRAVCKKLISEVQKTLGRLDILYNCAGMNRRKPITEVTDDDFDTIVSVNLRSLYFLSQAVYPIMKLQGGGKIIHIGSINIFYGLDTVSVYGLTKGAVGQLTKIMAVEWATDNIQVNCITPGFILTPMTNPVFTDEKKRKWILNRIPAGRLGNPDDLIGTSLLLCSGGSDYITGQNFVVDGGFLAGGSWNRQE